MAKLVQCPTCGANVSSAAAACPTCAHPMASGSLRPRSAGVVVTGEKTGKSLKLATMAERILRPVLFLFGILFFAIGYAMKASTGNHGTDTVNVIGYLFLTAGAIALLTAFFWRVWIRLLIYWRHG